MKIKALFLDFDGLILETEGPIYQSWLELYQSYGAELPLSDFAQTIGAAENTFDLLGWLEERLGYCLPRDEIAPRRRKRELELVYAQPVMPGVIDLLHSAQRLGLKRAVVSSSSRRWVKGHLSRLGLLELFDQLVTRDDVQRPKPDPELYLTALRQLEVYCNQAVAFEDSPNGIQAAKKAGIYCVAVPNALTRLTAIEGADLYIDSLADIRLEELVERIG